MIREYIYFVDDNPNGTSGMTEEEIIRCKDCKHWKGGLFGNKCTMLSCLDYVISTKENAYCSFANRKESEEK